MGLVAHLLPPQRKHATFRVADLGRRDPLRQVIASGLRCRGSLGRQWMLPIRHHCGCDWRIQCPFLSNSAIRAHAEDGLVRSLSRPRESSRVSPGFRGHVCRMHGLKVRNVQDDRAKLAHKFAHFPVRLPLTTFCSWA